MNGAGLWQCPHPAPAGGGLFERREYPEHLVRSICPSPEANSAAMPVRDVMPAV